MKIVFIKQATKLRKKQHSAKRYETKRSCERNSIVRSAIRILSIESQSDE